MKTFEIPEENAEKGLTTAQKVVLFPFVAIVILSLALTFSSSHTYLPYYLFAGIYLLFCYHKFFLTLLGFFNSKEIKVSSQELRSRKEWPMYTVLVPLYKEDKILKQLFTAIQNIDYPRDKLEVFLLLEDDDAVTQKYISKFNMPSNWKKIIIPDFSPKTKGKALDFGLRQAKGKYLVIYDAEDIPDVDQLKKAAVAFEKVSKNIVCLQAKLNYYNQDQNILTKWFTTEYTALFDVYLPGTDAIEAPIPLGGTSNHFRTDVLKKLKGWDPFNVTEDCDLGIRLFKAGYRTKVLDTTTWEEANSQLGNWIRQRSRWTKGYIQTYFVYMRHPVLLLKKLGLVNFLHFNVIVGGNFFIPVLNIVLWLSFLMSLLFIDKSYLLEIPFFRIILPVLLLGNLAFILINLIGVVQRRYWKLIIPALLSPVYWLLMSVGAWKGLWQYFTKPFYWEKTDHGFHFK